jgi:hypothetical protein
MEMFKEIPHEFVPAEDLAKLVNDKSKKFFLRVFVHILKN